MGSKENEKGGLFEGQFSLSFDEMSILCEYLSIILKKKNAWQKQDLFGNIYNFFSIFKKLRRNFPKMLHDSLALDGPSRVFSNFFPSHLHPNSSSQKQTTSIFQSHLTSFENVATVRRLIIQNELFFQISKNSSFITELSSRIDHLNTMVDQFNEQLDNISEDACFLQNQNQSPSAQQIDKNCQDFKKGRIHYKTIFRQKIFGVKQYKYKLHLQGKMPQIFFKERNICLNISLLNSNGQKIANQNAISLNLKVYYSNGEEVGPTKKGQNFIKGTVNSIMLNGKASFDKLYPREVSRKLDKRKIVLTIYPSRIGNLTDQNINKVEPEDIEPIIIYGIRVITKQTKDFWPKSKDCAYSEYSNQSCE